jgi:hypothetical protein
MVEINTLYVFKDIAAASDFSTNDKAFKFLPFALASTDEAPPKEDQILASYDNLPPDIITWLLGVDELLGIGVDVINSSLGAISTDFDPLDPRQIATRIIVEHNISFITSAGNNGPRLNSMQALAQAPWVIAVGATDNNCRLLSRSSRGIPEGAQPTVVSSGEADHMEGFKDQQPGTSFAAPKVARVCIFVKKMLQLIFHDLLDIQRGEWSPIRKPIRMPALGFLDTGLDPKYIPPMPNTAKIFYGVGNTVSIGRGNQEKLWYTTLISMLKQQNIVCHVASTPDVIKRALLLMAKQLPDYKPYEVGAGFVSDVVADSFFARFTPSQFVRLFHENGDNLKDEAWLKSLDDELGPLWNDETMSIFEDLFRYSYELYMIKVQ